jgi:Ca2+-binding EF-hand superfamily protein
MPTGLSIRGGNSSGLSEDYQRIASQVGIKKDELEDIRKKFKDAGTIAPKEVSRLFATFDTFDIDNDQKINLDELDTYAKKHQIDLTRNPFGIFGDKKGLTVEQLEVISDIADDKKLNTNHLGNLIESFDDYDKDGNGRVDAEELQQFAKKSGIESPANITDEDEAKKQFILTSVTRFINASDTTLGVVGGSLLEVSA